MSGQLDSELARCGEALAKAWGEPLTALAKRWQGQVADWNRVFPGLIATVGMQSLLWPRFISLAGRDASYAAPADTAGPQVFRFAYGAVDGSIGWVAVGLPALADWVRIRPVFEERDVRISLSTLTADNQIFLSGRAPGSLGFLVGRTYPGTQPAGLPVCECDAIVPMLPDWQASLQPAMPALAEAATAFRAARGVGGIAGAAAPGGDDSDAGAITIAFGRVAWHAWQRLLDDGVIQLTGGPAVANKSLLGRLFGARELAPFRGALLLRGDHWALWERIKETIAAGLEGA